VTVRDENDVGFDISGADRRLRVPGRKRIDQKSCRFVFD
jgi:hypothetical protein